VWVGSVAHFSPSSVELRRQLATAAWLFFATQLSSPSPGPEQRARFAPVSAGGVVSCRRGTGRSAAGSCPTDRGGCLFVVARLVCGSMCRPRTSITTVSSMFISCALARLVDGTAVGRSRVLNDPIRRPTRTETPQLGPDYVICVAGLREKQS